MKEYRIEVFKGSLTTGKIKKRLEEELNAIAAEGWELLLIEGAFHIWVREK
jgi:uncharacterized phage-like protein YoqJ